jgi:hypothetical protein
MAGVLCTHSGSATIDPRDAHGRCRSARHANRRYRVATCSGESRTATPLDSPREMPTGWPRSRRADEEEWNACLASPSSGPDGRRLPRRSGTWRSHSRKTIGRSSSSIADRPRLITGSAHRAHQGTEPPGARQGSVCRHRRRARVEGACFPERSSTGAPGTAQIQDLDMAWTAIEQANRLWVNSESQAAASSRSRRCSRPP